uniref:Uncharacterized protein n=1 Tax=Siphoviridae sp. ctNU74 TaxID=2825471 RepID=A0A8S5NXG2_9CAUD|nr:MAG TPA: hypothetical protein [Siphoviridae sp. ctNU74]
MAQIKQALLDSNTQTAWHGCWKSTYESYSSKIFAISMISTIHSRIVLKNSLALHLLSWRYP